MTTPRHATSAGAAPTVQVTTPFGPFTVFEEEVVSFPSGLPGFEECRRFVVLSPAELGAMSCLQSVEGPAASFLVVDPRRVLPHYRCVLSQTDRLRLGADDDAVLLWLAVVTVDQEGRGHANLRAPIVINPGRMLGYQVVPHNSLYPLRQPLPSE